MKLRYVIIFNDNDFNQQLMQLNRKWALKLEVTIPTIYILGLWICAFVDRGDRQKMRCFCSQLAWPIIKWEFFMKGNRVEQDGSGIWVCAIAGYPQIELLAKSY